MKLHIEKPFPPGTLFAIMPALCGRKKPTDYRCDWGQVPDDAVKRRARRPFFATSFNRATCKRCRHIKTSLSS